nr:MAG TPA: hypothetical protein [Caudoviricetes sp.]
MRYYCLHMIIAGLICQVWMTKALITLNAGIIEEAILGEKLSLKMYYPINR